jgi:phosphatidate phosphatase PAH1
VEEEITLEVNGVVVEDCKMKLQKGGCGFLHDMVESKLEPQDFLAINKMADDCNVEPCSEESLEMKQKIEEETTEIQIDLQNSELLIEAEQLTKSNPVTRTGSTECIVDPNIAKIKLPKKNRSLNSLLDKFLKKPGKSNEEEKRKDDLILSKTPMPETLAKLNLKDGVNKLKFKSTQTNQTAEANLYFWDHSAKVIISDIDGTITKTDKRGLFYHKLGYDWTHDHVVSLYSKIHEQGYKIVYLTARSARVQSATRNFLTQIKTPDGPILSAPSSLLKCVSTELWKTTAEVKLAHLRPLTQLFTQKSIVAGFGNRIHDNLCYQSVNIPNDRIYIINKQSEVSVNGVTTSYESLLKICHKIFPK